MIIKNTISEFQQLLEHKYRNAKREYQSGIKHGVLRDPRHYRHLGYLVKAIQNYDDNDIIIVSPTGEYNIYQGSRLIKYGRF